MRSASPKPARTSRNTEISLERIERMLLTCAELVDRRGPIAQPLLDRLEREYLAAKARGTAVDRIRQMIGAN